MQGEGVNGPQELHGVRQLMRQPQPERTCEQGCAGCDDCTDFEDDGECPRCKGDGMDPWNDYLFACPECGGREAL